MCKNLCKGKLAVYELFYLRDKSIRSSLCYRIIVYSNGHSVSITVEEYNPQFIANLMKPTERHTLVNPQLVLYQEYNP